MNKDILVRCVSCSSDFLTDNKWLEKEGKYCKQCAGIIMRNLDENGWKTDTEVRKMLLICNQVRRKELNDIEENTNLEMV